ncbi:MAG: rRNA maturation RNase YbeY [Candidatus Gastranaerophilales bacterium]|nr:rRNA maturation RNase YbeY [Candidatus Gastranaerophilales bacterium]
MTTINIFSENIHKDLAVDEKKAIQIAKKILHFYLKEKNIFNSSCLFNFDFKCISFDILYCDNEKTHQINKEYRQKDYPADIITFAIFADSEDKFVFDGEINLGEIIISLDKVFEKGTENVGEKTDAIQNNRSPIHPFTHSTKEELYFLIAHGILHLLGFDHKTDEEYTFIVSAQKVALQKVKGEA